MLGPTPIPPREMGLLLLLGILWGVPFALTKLSLETIPPVTLTAARVSIAAVALWVLAFVLQRKLPRRKGTKFRLFLQACIGCVIPYTFIAFGQRSVDSGLAAILNSTTPLFVFLISILWTHHERTTLLRLSGTLVGFGGVALVVGASALLGLNSQSVGQVAIVLATFSSALSVIHGRRFADIAPEIVAAGTLTYAAFMLVPASFLIDKPWDLLPSIRSVAALLANAIVATAFGFLLYFRLIRTIGSMNTASTSYLKPAVSVLVGCTVLGEPFTWTLLVGLLAIFFGIATINGQLSFPDTGSFLRQTPNLVRRPAARSSLAIPKQTGSASELGQR